jgi:hypothetical protein
MELEVDIYQLESGHIHVVPRSCAEGMIDFDGTEAFARFVARCQEFIENERHAKKTMEWLEEQNHRIDIKPSEALENATDSRKH